MSFVVCPQKVKKICYHKSCKQNVGENDTREGYFEGNRVGIHKTSLANS